MKYPNGYFRIKPCRCCGKGFQPEAPSHLYCSDSCIEDGRLHAYLMRTYGITLASYRELHLEQAGKCDICKGEGFLMDKDRHRLRLVVDHDHDTGAVRGLLCHNCNRALGLLKDSPEFVASALEYLLARKEGATTIPRGSTPEAIAGGSAGPSNFGGEDIVWTRRKRLAANKD